MPTLSDIASMRETPRNPAWGHISDFLNYLDKNALQQQFGYRNPVTGEISEALGIPAASRVANKLSYGEPITNVGKANVPLIPEDTAEAAMFAAPLVGGYGKLAKNMAGEAINNAIVYGEGKLAKITPQPLRIFVGPNSATFDKVNAVRAHEMEKAGIDPEKIWQETGTFRGPDKQWRQEINDLNAKANYSPMYSDVLNAHSQFEYGKPYHSLPFGEVGLGEMRKKVSDLAESDMIRYKTASGSFPHPNLYKAYSELQNIKVEPYKSKDISGSYQKTKIEEGSLKKPQKTIKDEKIVAEAPNEEELKSVMVHEMQHAIQTRENFARGGSPNEYSDIANKIREHQKAFNYALEQRMNTKDPVAKDNLAQVMSFHGIKMGELKNKFGANQNDFYKRIAGEAEARAAQKRMNLSDEDRRRIFPLHSYDVPIKDLIFLNQ